MSFKYLTILLTLIILSSCGVKSYPTYSKEKSLPSYLNKYLQDKNKPNKKK